MASIISPEEILRLKDNLDSKKKSYLFGKEDPTLRDFLISPFVRQPKQIIKDVPRVFEFGKGLLEGGAQAIPFSETIKQRGYEIGQNLKETSPGYRSIRQTLLDAGFEAQDEPPKPFVPRTGAERAGQVVGGITSEIGQFYLAGKAADAILSTVGKVAIAPKFIKFASDTYGMSAPQAIKYLNAVKAVPKPWLQNAVQWGIHALPRLQSKDRVGKARELATSMLTGGAFGKISSASQLKPIARYLANVASPFIIKSVVEGNSEEAQKELPWYAATSLLAFAGIKPTKSGTAPGSQAVQTAKALPPAISPPPPPPAGIVPSAPSTPTTPTTQQPPVPQTSTGGVITPEQIKQGITTPEPTASVSNIPLGDSIVKQVAGNEIQLSPEAETLFQEARQSLTTRQFPVEETLQTAQRISEIEDSPRVEFQHLAEAIQLKGDYDNWIADQVDNLANSIDEELTVAEYEQLLSIYDKEGFGGRIEEIFGVAPLPQVKQIVSLLEAQNLGSLTPEQRQQAVEEIKETILKEKPTQEGIVPETKSVGQEAVTTEPNREVDNLVEGYAKAEDDVNRLQDLLNRTDAQESPKQFSDLKKQINQIERGQKYSVSQISAKTGLDDYETVQALSNYIDIGKRRGNRTLKDFYDHLNDIVSERRPVKENQKLATDTKINERVSDLIDEPIASVESTTPPEPVQGVLLPRGAVSVEPTSETKAKIAAREETAAQKAEDIAYREWADSYKDETISAAQLKNKAISDLKKSTDQGIKDRLNDEVARVFAPDYRTPEYVFEAFGLKDKIYKPIKEGQGRVTDELREYTEQANDWWKRIARTKPGRKASSKKVFRWLDGDKTIELTQSEQEVANEIKSYLAEWADRLDLPEDRRITNYITHIFEPDFEGNKRVFPDELAKILDYVTPNKEFNPFLERRLGAKGYKEDVFEALDAYVYRGARKIHLDKALNNAADYVDALPLQASRYTDSFLKNFKNRPSDFEKWLDQNILQSLPPKIRNKLGNRPARKLTGLITSQIYRSTLGLNVGSAIKNVTQGVNTFAELGTKYTSIGYSQLMARGAGELKENNVLDDMVYADYKNNSLRNGLRNLDTGLFVFFETAEKINRGSAYYGAKQKFLDENPGASEREAVEFAKDIVRKTQFAYGKLDTPLALQSPTGKLFFTLATYPLKQSEFIGGYAKKKQWGELARYILSSLVIVATVGEYLNMDYKDVLFKNVMPSLGIVPSAMRDLLGPEWKREKAIKNIVRTLTIPAAGQIKKIKAAVEGESRTDPSKTYPEGQQRFKIETPSDIVKTLLSGEWSTSGAEKYLKDIGIIGERDFTDDILYIITGDKKYAPESDSDNGSNPFSINN